MSIQIRPSVTNPTIADIYTEISDGRLILKPDFQRKFVWTHEHQEAFIDTILKGLPFPEIYVCEGELDIKKLRTTKLVIDGQQRLTTIRNYIDGKSEKPFTNIPAFDSLDSQQKNDFVKYQLVVRDLGQIDDATTREIFRRINLTKFKLDDIEIHNAVYDGHFISAAKDILNHVSFEDYGVLKESELTRMADLYFILLIMTTLENGGYFAQDREIEPIVAKYNDEYPNKKHMISQIIKVFAIIKDLDLPADSMWFRKSNFLTITVELAKNINKIPNDLRERLIKFENNVMENKLNTESPYYKYYSYMFQGTHSRSARVTRGEQFEEEIFG
ncbi:DUF262 domain-containing protein [Escherichia coli]|uniref:DUF262 domain-containing protein n=1 Tax=Escherichia coli TaxID=562 RepID=UPI000B7CACE8|nr:DUF262 domain-containing protein [Escherichia coli]EEW0666027.1 DUF262 domain-containing protein [Escherichia coli]EEZ5528215.1 DUF262 domain-containing protein [Escherichia coli]EFB2543055.1 DUF262 domain-containing protein [Escherichia coli]ELO5979640.1 DUF262 domain-containing protein [Escherichia coli]MBB9526687.1 DUF262 domain-containing protein [Escherichia coli]